MNNWKCKFCIYYREKDKYDGECYRYPPIVLEGTVNLHPTVAEYDYCGEWKEIPK